MWCRISTKTWALQGNYTGFLGQFETVMVTHPIFSDSSGDGERLFAGVDCTSARNEMTKSFMRHYIRCTRMYFRDSLGVGKSGGPWGYYHGGWLAECTWCSPKLFARRPRCCQRLLGESREQEIPKFLWSCCESQNEDIAPGQSMTLKFYEILVDLSTLRYILFVPRSQDVGEDHSPECIVKRIRSLLEAGRETTCKKEVWWFEWYI